MEQTDFEALAEAGGVSTAYIRMVLNNQRWPSIAVALRIYDKTGAQLGLLKSLDSSEIEAVRKSEAQRPQAAA